MAPKYQDPYLSSVEEGLILAHQKMLLFLWYEEVRGNIVVLIWYIFHSFTNASIEGSQLGSHDEALIGHHIYMTEQSHDSFT